LVIDDLLDELHRAIFFTKLDLQLGDPKICIKEEDIPKITFQTHEGHYESVVIPDLRMPHKILEPCELHFQAHPFSICASFIL
jgi:hypothetical protein